MKRIFFAWVFLTSLVLPGCDGTQGEVTPVRVVTQIQVTATENGQIWQKTFSNPDKMGAVLHCLRTMEPGKVVPIAPDSFRTDAYEITVSYSDGNHTVYQQLYHQYLQRDSQGYREISERPAVRLVQLLRSMPGDHGLYS